MKYSINVLLLQWSFKFSFMNKNISIFKYIKYIDIINIKNTLIVNFCFLISNSRFLIEGL